MLMGMPYRPPPPSEGGYETYVPGAVGSTLGAGSDYGEGGGGGGGPSAGGGGTPTPTPTPAPKPTPGPTTTPTPTPTPTPAPAPTGPTYSVPPPYTSLPTTSPIQVADGVGQYNANDTDPALRELQDNELTSKNLDKLLNGDSRYIQDARLRGTEAASRNGMLMSSVSAGMSERAAIEAGLPIAQADAQAATLVYRDNQSARNSDLLADQQNRAALIGQQMGIAANLADAERNRAFQSIEQQRQNDFNAYQQAQAQSWQGTQNDLARLQDRQNTYYNQIYGREGQLTSTLNSIYSNPNLTAEQQQAAVTNANAMYSSLWNTMNATLANGVPEIYSNPYPSNSAAPNINLPTTIPGTVPMPATPPPKK